MEEFIMAEKKYKVGLIGCGGMGNSHAGAFKNNPRTELVAVGDINADAAKNLAEKYAVPNYYTDRKEMFKNEELDILAITTWQSVRAEIALDAIENTNIVGMFGEKPMCASLGEAQDMVSACDKKGVKLVIGHQRRFSSQNTEARKLIQEGAIGKPQVMMRRDGLGLLNRGTHEIDEMMYILGDPKALWVIGQTSRETDKWERRVRCEDLCMGLICFEGGIRGIYESDLPEPGLKGDVVYGSEGMLKRGENGTIMLLNNKDTDWQVIPPRAGETNQHEEFLDWLDGKVDSHRGEGHIAIKTMEIMMAIYESLRIKNVVMLPLQTRENPLDLMVEDGTLPIVKPGRYDIRAAFPEQK
jgi:UDP-N-acetyl-2-amino-2-deoxyglucuronate dehydrogenase